MTRFNTFLFDPYTQLMIPTEYARLIRFLQDELAVPQTAIKVALQHCKQDPAPLPMVLWQQGVLSLQQLERIFDWMEMA